MRVDGRPFIDYSDFHLPLSEQEIIEIEAARARPDKVKRGFSFGEGMNEVLSDEAQNTYSTLQCQAGWKTKPKLLLRLTPL
jgi:hypothetical protein